MANRNTLSTGLFLTLLFVSSSAYSQSINSNWKQDMNALLEKYLSCASSSTDTYPCSSFITESINKVYKVNGLYSDKSKRYLQLKEVSKNFDDAGQWTLLGHAYDQKVLSESQTLANANKAVVAVYKTAEGASHVALILPGEEQFSGTWNFKVPNSASFVLNDPTKSYVGKGLSYAFSRTMIKDVVLYVKKY
jgi:hypothetical protein